MSYYQERHRWYCGIDLHASTMFLSVCDATGNTVLHQNTKADPDLLDKYLAPYIDDLVICCECTFSWYWLADWCEEQGIHFVLGHALAMRAIHQAKTKNDSKDADMIVRLLRTGLLPMSHVYDRKMRPVRDLMRRRHKLCQIQTRFQQHSQILALTHKRQLLSKKLIHAANRQEMHDYYEDPVLQMSLEADMAVIETVRQQMKIIERRVMAHAKKWRRQDIARIQTIPGIGTVLSLTILFEVQTVERFEDVGNFLSYCRLITPEHRSAGKKVGSGNRKIGNAYLRWAFGEAAVLMLRESPEVRAWHDRIVSKKGKAKALTILSARIARTLFFMLKKKEVFEPSRFLSHTPPQRTRQLQPSP